MEKQVSALTNKYARRRLLKRSLALLCCVMLLFTMNTLKRNADTLERIPMCRQAEHVHSETCYDASGALICGLDEHVHTDACYQERPDAEAVEAMVAQEDVWFDGEDDADVEAVFEDADAEVEEVEAELDVDDEADEGVFDADEGEPVADDMENAVLLDAPKYLSEIIEGAQVEIALADVADIGLVEGDEPADLLWIERDGEDYLIGAKQDFDAAELAVVTADDIIIINLVNGVAQAEPTEEVEELNEVASPEEAEPVEAEEVTEDAVTEDEEPAAGITEDVEAEEVTEEEAEETEEPEESEEAEVAEEVTEEEAEAEESEEAEETEKTEEVEESEEAEKIEETEEVEETEDIGEEAEETEAEPDAEQAEETEEVEDEAEAAPAYAATIDLGEVEAYPLSLRALMQAARPAEEPVAEETIIEEETQEDPAEDADAEAVENAEPEAVEQPEEAAWEIEYDNELLNIEAAEGDYWVTPVQSFESTMIAVSDGSRYELTLIHCDIPSEEAEEEAEDATEETEEPQAAEESATVYPAQGFEARTRFVKVSVTAPEGAFPEGTEMNVVDVDDADTLSDIEQTVGEDFVEVKRVHAVDISFWHDGAEIEPLAPISVVMKVDEIEAQQDAVVVHVDDAGETEIVESQSDAPSGETELTVEMQAAEAPAEALAEPEAEQPGEAVAFEAETFSVYAVVVTETLETRYIDASGESWNISVGYGQDAGIPSGATLSVREVVGAESEDYLARTEDALKGRETVTLARFFDISILDAEGNEVQPAEPVEVRAVLAGETEDDVRAVHFADDGLELVDARREDEAVSFDAEGFSVWGVVYTVDFHYTANGQSFDYSIPGGDCASLRALLPILNVAADDPETEEDELEAFMAAIESVEFSDPELVRVCPVGAETTVGALREANGIESEYSKALTDEDRAAIDARALTAPDWALFSLKPFTTEETLTVAMNNGDRFAVAVTDAQIATRVLAADGQTYKITLTFGPEAGIPLDAELKAEEIGEGSIEWEMYCNQAKQAADIELDTPLDFVRFFDIEIQKEGRKIEPEGTVSVSIALADAPETAEEDALKVIHFEENGPVVMESRREAGAETAEMAGVSFETDSFSVYGLIVGPEAGAVDSLDGNLFKIKVGNNDNNYYLLSVNNYNDRPWRIQKTSNEDDAGVYCFETSDEHPGQYAIYTIGQESQYNNVGRKVYIHINHSNADVSNNVGSVNLTTDTPMWLNVEKNIDGTYGIYREINGTKYYLNQYGGNGGNGFASYANGNDGNSKLTLTEYKTAHTNPGKENFRMVIVKYNDKYYIVNNDASLTEVDYDPAKNTVKVDEYPMMWVVEEGNPNGHIYFNSTEAGFEGTQQASDWFRRYLDPMSKKGWKEEDSSSVTLQYIATHDSSSGPYYQYTVSDRTQMLSDTALNIYKNDNKETYRIYHGDWWINNYLGIKLDSNGNPASLTGNQAMSEAAEFLFATPTEVKNANYLKHSVNHIDISIKGTANVSVPLAYGNYYGSQGDKADPIKVVTENETLDLTRDQMDNPDEQLRITAEEMKGATLTAARLDNGTPLDDVFYITGYSGNVDTSLSSAQVRIEGSFLCADLRGTQYETIDPKLYKPTEYDDPYSNAVRQARKDNRIEYTVTLVKELKYKLIDPVVGQLYDEDGQPIEITVPVAFSASFDYWNEHNECPAVHYAAQDGDTEPWSKYNIDTSDWSGMDFQLGGNAEDENSPLVALEITKVIRDIDGNDIHLKVPVTNYFDIYQNLNKNDDQKNNDVKDLHVNSYGQADFRDATIHDGYTFWRSKHVTVDDTGRAVVFDFNAKDAMYYITERHDKESLPETVTDKDGNEYVYVKTHMETEYVRRGDQYNDKVTYPKPVHVTEDYTRDSGSYASIPEVAGKFITLKNEYKKEGFLEFFVYNCYSKLYPVKIKKVDSTNNSVTLSGAEFDLYGPYGAVRSFDTDNASDGRKYTKVNKDAAIVVGSNGIGDLGKLQSGIYYLYETKAPDGFNLLTEPVVITVKSKQETSTGAGAVSYTAPITSKTTVEYDEATKTYTLTVENTPGARLPATGGPGVAVYYALGSLLVLAAAALLIARRKQEL